MKRTILVFSIIISLPAHSSQNLLMGGNEVGNGGDVVVCREKDEIKFIQLLDFYESKEKDKREITTSLTTDDTILREVISNISKVDSKRGELFRKKVQSFLQETQFLTDIKLTDIPDSFHIVLPKEKTCVLEQIAILDKNQNDPSKRFIINKNLWDKLDPLNKAGLIMHEIVYEYFASVGEKNSIKARSYNAFIFRTYSQDQYWKFLKSLRLPIYQ